MLAPEGPQPNSFWAEDKSPHSSGHVFHYPNIYYSSRKACMCMCICVHVSVCLTPLLLVKASGLAETTSSHITLSLRAQLSVVVFIQRGGK